MTPAYDRRSFLRAAAAAGAGSLAVLDPAAAVAARAQRAPRLAREGSFAQGVVSGEPSQRAIALWTKLDGADRRVALGFEVAGDRGFRNVLHRGRAVVDPALGGTARVRVGGRSLRPGEQYFYRNRRLRARSHRSSSPVASAPASRSRRCRACRSSPLDDISVDTTLMSSRDAASR